MKKRTALIALLACVATPALAADKPSDDAKWVAACITDNKGEGQGDAVVVSYCTCMTNEMSDAETRSVTEWEKANPKVMEKCSKESGWKGK